MKKIYVKDCFGQKKLILAMSNKKDAVAIGEVIDENTEKYLHISIKDFVKFAKGVIDEVEDTPDIVEKNLYISRMHVKQLLNSKIRSVERVIPKQFLKFNKTLHIKVRLSD